MSSILLALDVKHFLLLLENKCLFPHLTSDKIQKMQDMGVQKQFHLYESVCFVLY